MPEMPSFWSRVSDYLFVRRAQQTVIAALLLAALIGVGVWWWRNGGGSGGLVDYDERSTRQAEFLVNVNTAGRAELAALPGVGDTLALRIIEHREQHGRFRTLEDLQQEKGVGPKTLANLKPHVRFD